MVVQELGVSASPRIETLRQEVEAKGNTALAAFWLEVAAEGTPIIERIAGDEEYVLATFLWRGDPGTRNVVLMSELLYDQGWNRFYARRLLHRLPETDLFYRSYRVRSDARFLYRFVPDDHLIPPDEIDDWTGWIATWSPDPLNQHPYAWPDEDDDGSRASLVELPAAQPQPWLTPQREIPTGRVDLQRLPSTILENERRVWVYTPPNFAGDARPYGLLFLFDGWMYTHPIPTPVILDNLFEAEMIPPLVAVMLDNCDPDARARELYCHPPMVDFLTDELIPLLRARYGVAPEPARTTIGGASAGGLAAAFAALRRPDVFGNVLVQSGAFPWAPDGEIEPEWLARQFAAAPRLPLRFYIEAGLFENSPEAGMPGTTLLGASRHLRNVLRAKGYPVHYVEYAGGHQEFNWRGTLADGLMSLSGSALRQ